MAYGNVSYNKRSIGRRERVANTTNRGGSNKSEMRRVPIKPYSQSTDGLLGSTINLAIVDKHYPKCSPDEIERKKAEALKRRQKKKPSSRKLSTVV